MRAHMDSNHRPNERTGQTHAMPTAQYRTCENNSKPTDSSVSCNQTQRASTHNSK